MYLNVHIQILVINMSTTNWQYLVYGSWVSFGPKHQTKLSKRSQTPSLDQMKLKTDLGILTGVPEKGKLRFKLHGDSEYSNTLIRQGPLLGDLPMIEIKDGNYPRLLSDECFKALFTSEMTPKTELTYFRDHLETFITKEGELFQEIDGNFVQRNYVVSSVSKSQMREITSKNFVWKFKGMFRWEKMRRAVTRSYLKLSTEKSLLLKRLFESFDPTQDATEYGPYQFQDYLMDMGHVDISLALMDEFHCIDSGDWETCDGPTNARIENARAAGKPAVAFKVKGHTYLLMFDSGSGASGAEPVVIRPTRYQKILESIEEQYEASINTDHRRQLMDDLYEILIENGHNPSMFLMSTLSSEDPLQNLSPEIRIPVSNIINQLNVPNTQTALSTRIQQFMPALLNKFKECDVKLSRTSKKYKETFVSPKIINTLKDGLSVPKSFKCNLKTLFSFMDNKRSWKMSNLPESNCDICMARVPTLKHCGSSKACLKCWAQAGLSTNMSCPFCRQPIEENQLKLCEEERVNNKRKRQTATEVTKMDINTIIAKIRQDDMYKDIHSKTSFSMKKWFVILLRRGLIKINQRPKHEQAAKTLEDALTIFKLM